MRAEARHVLFAGVIGLVAMMAVPAVALAQGVGVGVKGGPLVSTLRLTGGNAAFKKRTGFMGGLFIGGGRHDIWGVATEINFLKRSVSESGDKIDLRSLQIPLFLRLNVGSTSLNRVNVYALAGPAIDIKLKAQSAGIDISDDVEGYDASLIFAGGVEITRFIVEGRYIEGLRNIAKNLSSSQKIKTRGFAILFGVRFN